MDVELKAALLPRPLMIETVRKGFLNRFGYITLPYPDGRLLRTSVQFGQSIVVSSDHEYRQHGQRRAR